MTVYCEVLAIKPESLRDGMNGTPLYAELYLHTRHDRPTVCRLLNHPRWRYPGNEWYIDKWRVLDPVTDAAELVRLKICVACGVDIS